MKSLSLLISLFLPYTSQAVERMPWFTYYGHTGEEISVYLTKAPGPCVTETIEAAQIIRYEGHEIVKEYPSQNWIVPFRFTPQKTGHYFAQYKCVTENGLSDWIKTTDMPDGYESFWWAIWLQPPGTGTIGN